MVTTALLKTILLIPDGVSVRNFLCTAFIDQLVERSQVVVWHALPEKGLGPFRESLEGKVRWVELPYVRESLIARVLRQAKVYAQFYWQRGSEESAVMLAALSSSGRWRSRVITQAARLVGRLCGGRKRIVALDYFHGRVASTAAATEPYQEFLKKENPDLVFCTHQRSSRAVPAMLAASKLDIPTATFIYSWDNLSKGRMAVHADHFLVWSAHMGKELLHFYPDVDADRIHEVGTPQFEHYFDSSMVDSRVAFCTEIGVDPGRRIVCYSGCDFSSAPNDPYFLAHLAEDLRELDEAERPHLLFRRSPAHFSCRYDWVFERFPEIIPCDPKWTVSEGGDWTQIVATPADIRHLVNLVVHCDLVVNVGSTVAVDFAVLDKPAIYIKYDPTDGDQRFSVHPGYRMPHFRTVHDLQPVTWVKERSQLLTAVRSCLNDPLKKTAARKMWLEALTAQPMSAASSRCVDALVQVISAAGQKQL